MIVTSDALKEFIDISGIDMAELCTTLSYIGLEVEKRYRLQVPRNVVVGKVVKRIQHENADKLSVCDVDIGECTLQIVCGAKNVRVDMFVALAKVGAELPPKNAESKEPFRIVESEIRGVKSSGMICSSTELGLPEMGEGIMPLDTSIGKLILGKELMEYDIFNQDIIEIGLTPNRGDCLSVLGVAREISSSFNLILKQKAMPESTTALGVGRFLSIVPNGNLNSSLLYKIVEIKHDVTPLRIALTLAINQRYQNSSISNLLEYTTYMSGVLLNSYAMDDKKISLNNNEAKFIIKKDENNLDCVYSEINHNDKKDIYKISTIGVQTYRNEVVQYPRKFILEASFTDANILSNRIYGMDKEGFDAYVLYRSQRGLSTSLMDGMSMICSILQYLESSIYSGEQEVPLQDLDINITMTFSYICSVIGNDIPKEDIVIILKRLGFSIQATSDENFIIVTPPAFRSDIKTKQDISEEVLRMYRIDKVESKQNIFHIKNNESLALRKHKIQKNIRQNALSNSFIECVHYVFSHSKLLQDLGFKALSEDKALLNPITNDLDTLRPSLLPNMLMSVKRNKSYGYENIRLFEIGYVYNENREAALEMGILIHKKILDELYPHPKGLDLDFFSFTQILSNIIGKFECKNIRHFDNKLIHDYQNAYIIKDDQNIGITSKLHPVVQKEFDLDSVIFAQINMDALISILSREINISSFSRFQSNKRDITILIDKNISFSQVRSALNKECIDFITSITPLDVFNESESVNALSIRLSIQSDSRTLNDEEIKRSVERALEVLKNEFNAELKY